MMSLWTKLQRKYVKDIEDNLNITFNGKPTRVDADQFIKEHAEANRAVRKDQNKQTRPTGKQLRFIKDIEDILDVKFTGRTVKTASKFIQKHITEYSARMDTEKKIKRYYNVVADKIESYQRRRRQG
jgi:hypothetical protein